MVNRIKYTNDMIDKAISESNYIQNSTGIKIPFEYAIQEVDLDWNILLFGIENEYFDDSAAIEFAILHLEKDVVDPIVMDLACTKISEITHQELLGNYLKILSTTESRHVELFNSRKMLYLVLKWLYENRDLFENPFYALCVIYDDFGFPETIRSFIPYVPDEPDDNVYENAKEKLLCRWRQYLLSEQSKYLIELGK